jgi:glycosyltransferase involved in cell wall biosynthesis
MTQKPLLIVEFLADGHRTLHVYHLARFGFSHLQTDVCFLLPRALRDSVLAKLSTEESGFFRPRVRVIEEDPAWVLIEKWIKSRRLAQWLYVEYLNLHETKTSRLLYLHLESVIYQLALCPLPRFCTSGVMFRATFYYRQRRLLSGEAASRALFALKWTTAYLCAKRPGFERIFLLDPFAEEYAVSHWDSEKFKLVPDPLGPEHGHLRPVGSTAPIAERPVNLLIAGSLGPRKGLHSTADALSASTEETRRNVRLFVVGQPEHGSTDYVLRNLARLRDMGVKVESDLRFISDVELDQHLAQSDVVLTPYQGFKGSSGIAIRAAHFGKPVVSTNEGLLGHIVQRHMLGKAIDPGNVTDFSQCLDRIVSTGSVSGFDPARARSFADSCDPEQFARSLLIDSSRGLHGEMPIVAHMPTAGSPTHAHRMMVGGSGREIADSKTSMLPEGASRSSFTALGIFRE